MKNLLRKLHIGPNHEDQVDGGRITEVKSFHDESVGGGSFSAMREPSPGGAIVSTASSESPTSLSTSPASSESKLSGLWNAVKDSVGRVHANEKLSAPIMNAIGQLRQRLDSSSGGGDDSPGPVGKTMLSPPGSFTRGESRPESVSRGSFPGSEDQRDVPVFKDLQAEEEYQVQVAIALSVSGSYKQAAVAGVVESAQIEAAKRISLGLGPAAGNAADTVSYQYWACNTVEYGDVIPDGFYDVFGVTSDTFFSERMPLLADLQKMAFSETSKIEVVLVDRELDAGLTALEAKAVDLAASADSEDRGSLRTSLAQKLAVMVAEHMGGPADSEFDMLLRWQKTSWDEKNAAQNVVLNLGSLNIGLTRHRGLLFKVLADHVGIPCQLVKSRHYPGVEEEGAVNIIKLDGNREFTIDLMGDPGALLPFDRTVTNAPDVDASPKSTKTEHSSSLVSSSQSSPSGSTRSTRSDAADPSKERKDASIQKGNGASAEEKVPYIKLDSRHHSEPVELQGLDMMPVKHSSANRPSHFRSPSWTEGIGLPGGRQVKIVPKDVSQLVIDAAKENPLLAQKLHDVLLESGVIPDISPKPYQAQVVEDKISEDERRTAQEKMATVPPYSSKKRSGPGQGRPPIGTLRSNQAVADEGLQRLQRLDSVEGLGDRRPLGTPSVDVSSPSALLPVTVSVTPSDGFPAAVSVAPPTNAVSVAPPTNAPLLAVPVVSAPKIWRSGDLENNDVHPQTDYIRHVPVAAAAAAAATAAVVASTMVAAAARGEAGGDRKMELPIAAAATATAAVVAATSAVAGKRVDSNETSPANSSHQPDPHRQTRFEEIEKEEVGHRQRHSDDRTSETGGSTPGNSHRAVNMSEDGLDGEVSAEEERSSENVSIQKRYDEILADVAEWEIPWEDIEIGDRIGIGSYGEVYRGDWHGSEVAVKKFLDQDLSGYALDEFRSEVRIMRRLRHPNVVLFMGAITRAPHLSIVTEFLPRGSLYRLIHRPNSQIDERRRLRMALDVAKGMNYLHNGNPVIVHRDLKSPNLLVDKNWVVKVCDFGLSRMKHNTFLSSKSTAGTPEWMAPEMLRNEPSNEKCDVYSFGVILWELATLKQPWGGMNPMQVVGAVGFQYRRLDIPPEMDPGLASIIRECWHDNPNLRPSFSQLMAALRPLQRPLSAAQQAENSSQGQTSKGSTIRSTSQVQQPTEPLVS